MRVLCVQVRNRWDELSGEEHQKVLQLAYQHMKDGEVARLDRRGGACCSSSSGKQQQRVVLPCAR